MTMKTAQDISPAAIVCLSLAMLIGNMYVGEISEYMGGQKAKYVSGPPSAEAKAMLVDVSEGRLLERLPDYSGSGTGQVASAYSQDVYSEAVQKVAVESFAENASYQDLRKLSAEQFARPALAGDSVMFLLGACFTLLAVVIMRVDILETAAQLRKDRKAEPPKMSTNVNTSAAVPNSMGDIDHTTTEDANHILSLKSIILICAMALSALGLHVSSASSDIAGGQEPFVLYASVQELKNLAASPVQQDLSIAPDSFVMLVLGAFVLLAVIIMKTDVKEMAKQATSEEGPPCEVFEDEVAYAKQETNVTPTMFNDTDQLRSAKFVFYISAVAWAAMIFLLWACTDHCEMTSPSVENELAQELRASLVSVHQHSSIAPDSLVMLGLGAFSMLAMAVMRTDISEMAAESHKTPTNAGKPMAEHSHDACSSEGQGAEPLKIFAGEKTVAVAMSTIQIKGEDAMQPHTFHLFVSSIFCISAVALSALALLISSASFETAVDQQPSCMYASVQELRDLVAGAVQHHLSFAPDSFVMLVLAAFVLLAVGVMKVDTDEMANEVQPCKLPADNDKSPVIEHAEREVAPPSCDDFHQLPRDKSIGFCIIAVAFSVAIFSQCLIWICEVGFSAVAALASSAALKAAVGQEPSPLHASTQELRNLAAGLVQQDSSFAPDSFAMLVLGAFVLLAVIVMKVDMDEMAEEEAASQPFKVFADEDTPAAVEQDPPITFNDLDQHPRGKCAGFCISAVSLAAIGLLFHLAYADQCKMLISTVETASIKELRDFLVPVYQHSLIASDRLVILTLGACSLLATAVMTTDFSEMAETQQEASSSDAKGARVQTI